MRRRLAGALLAIPLALTVGLAGCGGDDGGDGIATAGNGGNGGAAASPSASASGGPVDAEERRLQFARCMRENGVEMPDPGPDNEGGRLLRFGAGVDPKKVETAMEQCRQYLPNGGERPQLSPEEQEKLREYAKCMRDNGVTGFPDPSADGGIRIDRNTLKINPDDPTFKAAQEKCRDLRPQFRQGGGGGR
ncbi:hypothetical protein [Plantactinospora sp. GCM10030261]|uniref:hypothetical protein n=1 Tax=Plantactinospora sp. GCM10030261 TaxID=3273420 RepID=UPI00362423B8